MQIDVRQWDVEDVLDFHELPMYTNHSIKRVWKHVYPDKFLSSIARLHIFNQADTKKYVYRAITLQNEVCGHIECMKVDDVSCELVFCLKRIYWKQGIMKHALQQMCDEVFVTLNVMYIYANVHNKNIGACKVLEYNGFLKEQKKGSRCTYKKEQRKNL